MTYTGLPNQTWIDQCTYWNLAKTLKKRPDPPVLLVRGLAFQSGARAGAVLWPMYDQTGTVDLNARAPLSSEHWSFIIRDVREKPLASFPFEPAWRDENGAHRDLIAFAYQLPRLTGAASLELRGPNGVSRTETLSANAPALRIASPISGSVAAVHKGKVRVRWSAHASRPLLATVLYSPDGNAWYPSVFEAPLTSAAIAIDRHAATQRVKVVVTDGGRSSEAVTTFRLR